MFTNNTINDLNAVGDVELPAITKSKLSADTGIAVNIQTGVGPFCTLGCPG